MRRSAAQSSAASFLGSTVGRKIRQLLKTFAPLIIAMSVAFAFALAHVIIETGLFEYGPLSKKGLIHLLDLKALDVKLVNRKMDPLPKPKVVVAAIDEKGVERYGLWPWSRAVIAQFVQKATEGGAKVIAFDGVFSDEDKNSSYRNIKRFVTAYEDAGLGPEAPAQKALLDQVRTAEQAQAESQKALHALEARVAEQKGPAKAALNQALAQARRALEKDAKNLAKARTALAEQGKRAAGFYDMMRQEVANESPDKVLADAIAKSPQTILGYFNFYSDREFVGVSKEDAAKNLDVLNRVAINEVYENTIQEVGGQELELIQPADVDINNLWVTHAIGARVPLPILAKNATAFGYFNVVPDEDGPFRRIRMFNKYNGKLVPALSLIAAARYFGSDIRPLNGLIRPGQTLDGIAPINPDSYDKVPTDMQGRLLINYYTNPAKYFPTHSVADFIDGTLPNDVYKDKVVLFGATAKGYLDLRPTPFDPQTPGVYIHAQAIQNIIDGKYLQRWYGLALLEALAYLLLGLLMGLVLPRIPAWAGLLATVAFAGGLYLVDVNLVFPKGIWMLNVLPIMQATATFLGVSVYGYLTEGKEKRQIRKAFQFYITKSVVDEVLKDPTKLKLGGDKRNCTVLFSDVRGFTTISERLSPEDLVALLNSYLTPMTDIVYKYDGTLDKYIGDAIMAIFGAPVATDDHASRACYVCLEMMESLRGLQEGWRAQGLPELDIGIGLNSGWVSAGNMGSSQRFDYTVMGDNVNLASRLESINKQYGTNIIISESTYDVAQNDVYVREMDLVRVKGKREPVKIYELLGKGKNPSADHAPLVELFHQAIYLYRAQKWDEAIAIFERVRADIKANDYASGMYIDRCEKMRGEALGPDWDGVFTMTTK